MRTNTVLSTVVATLAVAASASAQRAVYNSANLEVTNFRGVISTSTHPATGNNYPADRTFPAEYNAMSGVLPGTRAWTYTPQERFEGGAQPPNYVTITGMTQSIFVGAGTQTFPAMQHYQFKTGIAPVATTPRPEGFRHAATGNDIVSFPAGTVMIPNWSVFRHSFTLTTPVPITAQDLCLYVEYTGGEQRDDPNNGQTVGCDWRGGGGVASGRYFGFTTGPSTGRRVLVAGQTLYRAQIGMLVEEPVFSATGFHANVYDGNPLANEDYLGLQAAFADWRTNTTPNATFFPHVSAGPAYGNGQAVLLANILTVPIPIQLPTPFGQLFLTPADPAFTGFATAGLLLNLDPQGYFGDGPNNPVQVPTLNTAQAGTRLKIQAAVIDAMLQNIKLTNASTIVLQ